MSNYENLPFDLPGTTPNLSAQARAVFPSLEARARFTPQLAFDGTGDVALIISAAEGNIINDLNITLPLRPGLILPERADDLLTFSTLLMLGVATTVAPRIISLDDAREVADGLHQQLLSTFPADWYLSAEVNRLGATGVYRLIVLIQRNMESTTPSLWLSIPLSALTHEAVHAVSWWIVYAHDCLRTERPDVYGANPVKDFIHDTDTGKFLDREDFGADR